MYNEEFRIKQKDPTKFQRFPQILRTRNEPIHMPEAHLDLTGVMDLNRIEY